MLSHRKGDLSAVAKAEILSPEISIIVRSQALHNAETRDGLHDDKSKCNYSVPGAEVAAGKSTVMPELGRSVRLFRQEKRGGVEKTTKRDSRTEFGSVHSRADEKGCLKGLAEEHGATDRTVPFTEAEIRRIKRMLITPYAETHTGEAQPKSRMWEICTSGSVRDSYSVSHGCNIVALRTSKERSNSENKLNLTEVL